MPNLNATRVRRSALFGLVLALLGASPARAVDNNPVDIFSNLTNSTIVANGKGAITGPVLNAALNKLVPIFTSIGSWDVNGNFTLYPGSVTFGQLQNVGALSLVGNPTNVPASARAITLGSTLSFSGSVLQLTNAATIVNGQTCTLGSTCTITASAGTITPGTTTVSSASANCNLYNNAGTLGCVPTLANGVYVTNGSGVPSIATTLPSGLTIPSPTFSGTVAGANTIPNAVLVNSTISGIPLGSNLPALTIGAHLTGTSYNGTGVVTVATDAASANTASTIVARDASGNFAAGTVTASLTGLASLNLPLAGGTMTGAVAFGSTAAASTRGSAGLNIDNLCQNGDSAYTIAATCRQVITTTAFTASRAWTVPAAAAVSAGYTIAVLDAANAVNATNTLVLTRSGSDLINGASTQSLGSSMAYSAGAVLTSDGVSKWTYTPAGAGGGGGGVSSITAGASLTATGGASGGTITTSGTLDLSNQTRGNMVLDHVALAKLLGTPLKGIDTFADGFANQTGYQPNGSGSTNTIQSSIAKTVSSTSAGGTVAGPTTAPSSSSTADTWRTWIAQAGLGNTGYATTTITFGGVIAVEIDNVYIQVSAGGSTPYAFSTTPVPCLFPGSAASIITPAGGSSTCTAAFTIPSSGNGIVISHSTPASFTYGTLPTNWTNYYKTGAGDNATVAATGYTSYAQTVDLLSVQSVGPPNNITLASAFQTADATVTTARSSIILDAAPGAITWGTTDKMEVTCNGATYLTATPVFVGANQYGNQYETPDTPCTTSGTSYGSRYSSLTNGARTIYGLSTTVH